MEPHVLVTNDAQEHEGGAIYLTKEFDLRWMPNGIQDECSRRVIMIDRLSDCNGARDGGGALLPNTNEKSASDGCMVARRVSHRVPQVLQCGDVRHVAA